MRHLAAFSLVLLAGLACTENNLTQLPSVPPTGDIEMTGRVCDTESRQWLEGATVYTHLVNDDGALYDTLSVLTDEDGRWTLEQLRANTVYEIYVQHGSAIIEKFEVTTTEDDVVLDEPDCSGGTDVRVAVVTGDYDDFGEVLGSLGISNYDIIDGTAGDELVQFLGTAENLTKYDAVFFPGGHLEEDVIYDTDGSDTLLSHEKVKDAVRAYVNDGGVVYASDWSYDVVEQFWPGKIEFVGRDEVPGAAQLGEPVETPTQLIDEDLAAAVGGSTCKIEFDLDAWPVMESVGDGVIVHQTADVSYREGFETFEVAGAPLLVSFEVGDGKVVFSSWRQSSNLNGKPLSVIGYMIDGL